MDSDSVSAGFAFVGFCINFHIRRKVYLITLRDTHKDLFITVFIEQNDSSSLSLKNCYTVGCELGVQLRVPGKGLIL